MSSSTSPLRSVKNADVSTRKMTKQAKAMTVTRASGSRAGACDGSESLSIRIALVARSFTRIGWKPGERHQGTLRRPGAAIVCCYFALVNTMASNDHQPDRNAARTRNYSRRAATIEHFLRAEKLDCRYINVKSSIHLE